MKMLLITFVVAIFLGCSPKKSADTSNEQQQDTITDANVVLERTSVKVEVLDGLSH